MTERKVISAGRPVALCHKRRTTLVLSLMMCIDGFCTGRRHQSRRRRVPLSPPLRLNCPFCKMLGEIYGPSEFMSKLKMVLPPQVDTLNLWMKGDLQE
jgi:hypothetical protein